MYGVAYLVPSRVPRPWAESRVWARSSLNLAGGRIDRQQEQARAARALASMCWPSQDNSLGLRAACAGRAVSGHDGVALALRVPAMPSTPSAMLGRLLDEALALPPDRRLGWVDGLGPDCDALKARLRALVSRSLAAESSARLETLPSVVGGAADEIDGQQFEGAVLYSPGSAVGRYRLERRLGAGAMGAVWLARARDAAEPQVAALKFAHVAPRRPDLLLRLARERGLLAALDHPNIARLYDAGVTEQGHPYLVLEYVEGEPLDAHCAAHALGLQARLRLFVQIADAVAHAHARQIVHRDLKPANVQVTARGVARLLDFGVGSLLADGVPQNALLSAIAGRPLTLAYASPEQLVGDPVGFASDIYALGVMLYELIAHVHPHGDPSGSTRALREAILFAPPQPPSARVDIRAEERQLRTALDAIALRALSKRPEQRQASARVLSMQVVHALAGL